MERRSFMRIAGRIGFGATVPLLAPLSSESIGTVEATGKTAKRRTAATPSGGTSLAMPLDTGWSVATDPTNIGRSQAWFKGPQAHAKPTPVPSIIQQAYPGYHGVAWYWMEFKPGTHPLAGGRFLLRFHAVDYLANVWLNDHYVGAHEGGESPFVFDVTDIIRPDRPNRMAVRVLNPSDTPIDGIKLAETPHRNKVVKFTNGSLWDYGGIIRPVELLLTPAIRVSDIFVDPDWKSGHVKVKVELQNSSGLPQPVEMTFIVTESGSGVTVLTDAIALRIAEGQQQATHQVAISNYRLWSLDNPFLYQLSVSVEPADVEGNHQAAITFGFRNFCVTNGYFRLNGKRIFLKCTHTGNHSPFGQVNPPSSYPDLLRQDLLYAKASGFNMVRFISGLAHPYQLDLCDQLGLLVYEESAGSWLLKDSPRMKNLYEDSVREMILRDRNHPSLAMWGLLNETVDGPVFREAVAILPLVRSLDNTRLVLLSSGRFEGDLEVGSVSNPGSSEWEYVWGKEAPGAGHVALASPSGAGSGDFHLYPSVPQTPQINNSMRSLGQGGKPVFLSEYGIGSMMNVIHEARMYEQAGVPKEAEDFLYIQAMVNGFSAAWARFGMDTVYPYPEMLLEISQRKMARHRLLGFNLIRSNPMICGFNLTGMLDHAMTGEGIWRFWRDWKPELFDAMRNGWAPVRWCLFVEPTHSYIGRAITLEAVLANEDVLRPGDYPVEFQAWGPSGRAWSKHSIISIPNNLGKEGPLAVPVMKEQAVIQGPAGSYDLVPSLPQGVAPPDASWQFYLSDPASLPKLKQTIVTWGIPDSVTLWLASHGVNAVTLQDTSADRQNIILAGNTSGAPSTLTYWKKLAEHLAKGSTVVFLSPQAFEREGQSSSWLPLINKGRIYKFNDFLYHKECVAKPHPIFEGLQANGILDWYYFGPMLPSYLFEGQDTPDEVIAAAFAAGYSTPGGYASGVLLGLYKFGAGQFIVNTFPILDCVDKHPVADRLLLNLISYAAALRSGRAIPTSADLNSMMEKIGYVN